MQYLEYAVLGVGIFFSLSWIYGIRTYTYQGRAPTMATVNMGMLFTLSLIALWLFDLSAFHLLWMLPASMVLGLLTIVWSIPIFKACGQMYFNLACLGLDPAVVAQNQAIVEQMRAETRAKLEAMRKEE